MSSTANSKHYEMLIHNESCFMKYDVWLIPQIETGCLPYRVHQNICPGERTTIMMCYPGHIFSFIRSARMPAPITDPTEDIPISSRLQFEFDPMVEMYVIGKTDPWSFIAMYPPKPSLH